MCVGIVHVPLAPATHAMHSCGAAPASCTVNVYTPHATARVMLMLPTLMQCCSHPWINCCLETTALLNSNSTANRGHEQCLQEARRQHQVTVAAVVQRGAVQEAVTKTGGENAVSKECSLSGDQKVSYSVYWFISWMPCCAFQVGLHNCIA